MTADLPALAGAMVPAWAGVLARRATAVLLGLSFFCWWHLTFSRQPFPGSPASHDIYLYAAPAIALLAIFAARRDRRPIQNRLVIAGGVLWIIVSLIASRAALDPELALAWTLWLGIALGLLAGGVDRQAVTAGMAIGVAANLPLMLYQAVVQTTWPGAAIQGWAGGELTPAVKGAAVLGAERWLRPYGLMPHPNIAGGTAAVACALLAALWLRERRLWQLVLVSAAFSEALLSFSRSAWLGAIGGLVVLMCLRRRNIRALLAAVLLPAILFGAAYSGFVLQRTAASGTLEADSVSQRIYLVDTALLFWRQHPLVGIGPAQFNQAEVNVYGQSFIPEPVHNGFFLVLAETGIAGLLGAALVIAGVARRAVKAREWDTAAAGVAAFGPLMLDHYLMTTGIGLVLLAAVLSRSSTDALELRENRLPVAVPHV